MKLGPLCAWITVDGVNLSEFAVEISADGKEATCWIPSECDKKFSVNCEHTDPPLCDRANVKVTVDGISCGSKSMVVRDHKLPRIASVSRDSVATSPYARRPLAFGKQALTDDDAFLHAAISPELGTIKVEVRNTKPGGPREEWRRGNSRYDTQVLHERSKKAMGHSVQFGAEFPTTNARRNRGAIIGHLATFIFKYRPIEILRAQGIAPPEVRKDRVVSATDILDLTVDDDETTKTEEITKLEERLAALKRGSKQPERDLVGVQTKIKKEERIFQPGEVIDLT
ncbi:hypothetical protein C8R44DRAFT_798869 [Mycena epipterygia]|nr:hypothetical protein C8R44DRAFT_798869 [Mycena epipterygia]